MHASRRSGCLSLPSGAWAYGQASCSERRERPLFCSGEVWPRRLLKAPLRGVGLEFGREGFEVGAGDGGAVEAREFFGVGDRFNLFKKTLRSSLKADFQRLEDGLLL